MRHQPLCSLVGGGSPQPPPETGYRLIQPDRGSWKWKGPQLCECATPAERGAPPLQPYGDSAVSPTEPSMSPASATRKYYKGRKGPMLREHTSLTFTQKISPPTTQIFFLGRRNPPRKALPSLAGRALTGQRRLRCRSAARLSGGGGRGELRAGAASVKMALAKDWRTARRNGRGR